MRPYLGVGASRKAALVVTINWDPTRNKQTIFFQILHNQHFRSQIRPEFDDLIWQFETPAPSLIGLCEIKGIPKSKPKLAKYFLGMASDSLIGPVEFGGPN